ncbi:MAG: hypothetical protein R2759_20630 [Bacteroidales bacterium]
MRKYIGSYAAAMGGVDLIVFAGGIGENGDITRETICRNFEFMGLQFDKKANKGLRSKEALISKPDSAVKVVVIPTNEELAIAEDTFAIVKR